MVNRLLEYFEEPRNEPEQDYWEVSGPTSFFCVDEATARGLIEELGRLRPPRWLTFTDLFGGTARVRSREVQFVVEHTAAQRAAARAFQRALQQEAQADRPWDE